MISCDTLHPSLRQVPAQHAPQRRQGRRVEGPQERSRFNEHGRPAPAFCDHQVARRKLKGGQPESCLQLVQDGSRPPDHVLKKQDVHAASIHEFVQLHKLRRVGAVPDHVQGAATIPPLYNDGRIMRSDRIMSNIRVKFRGVRRAPQHADMFHASIDVCRWRQAPDPQTLIGTPSLIDRVDAVADDLCGNQFFTTSFGSVERSQPVRRVHIRARSSGGDPASPRRRAGVAPMAWRSKAP